MSLPPKAQSVNQEGVADNFVPPMAFQSQILEGGYTRLAISSPSSKLAILHRALASRISTPCKLRYVRMVDRHRGQLPKPESFVAVEISQERLIQVLQQLETLFYHDGRNQLWIQGHLESEQLILDELGMLYIYPDDFLYRDALEALGWVEAKHESMASRDYVQVNFLPAADAQEQALIQSLGMVRWEG